MIARMPFSTLPWTNLAIARRAVDSGRHRHCQRATYHADSPGYETATRWLFAAPSSPFF